MKILPLTGYIGAEITDVDLRALTDAEVAAIDQAITDHKVLAFRDQMGVTARQLRDAAARFGEPETAPHYKHRPVDGLPSVLALVTDGKGFGGVVTDNWHSDRSPESTTDFLSFLQAIEIPPYGRDTMFADMEAAYENLSAPIRAMLEGLTAIHSYPSDPSKPPVEHPVLKEDPRTGRKTLYVNKVYTRAIKGLRPDESDAILALLFRQAHVPEFQCRMQWRPGTIVAWDNQRTQHYIVQDKAHDRVMHRVMVERALIQPAARAA
ncbi:MAG: TauD/TfdA dioxygenase family protein [Flavobacteriaceae bacterium]